jgi:hypothetical protein
MRKPHPLGIVLTAAATIALAGSGIASADNEYNGQTYAAAQQAITNAGLTSRIGSTVGDQLPTNACIVSGSQTGPALDSSGSTGASVVVLDLNCDAVAATQTPQRGR